MLGQWYLKGFLQTNYLPALQRLLSQSVVPKTGQKHCFGHIHRVKQSRRRNVPKLCCTFSEIIRSNWPWEGLIMSQPCVVFCSFNRENHYFSPKIELLPTYWALEDPDGHVKPKTELILLVSTRTDHLDQVLTLWGTIYGSKGSFYGHFWA